MRRIIEEQNKL